MPARTLVRDLMTVGVPTCPAAFLSYRHILRHMAAKDEEELKDLGLAAERKSPIEQFIERRDEARRKAGIK